MPGRRSLVVISTSAPATFLVSGFSSEGKDLVANVRAGNAWADDFELRKIGKPADRDEWFSTPHLTKGDLFKKSGHLDFYADGMFPPMQLDGEYDEDGNCTKQPQDPRCSQ